MDTKLRNSKRIRNQLAILFILIISVMNMIAFYVIESKVNEQGDVSKGTQTSIYDPNQVLLLYRANQVLYKEAKEKVAGMSDVPILNMFSDTEDEDNQNDSKKDNVNATLNEMFSNWEIEVSEIFNGFDYYITVPDSEAVTKKIEWKNTDFNLASILDYPTEQQFTEMKARYSFYITMEFDEKGNMTINHIYSVDDDADTVIKYIQQFIREQKELEGVIEENGFNYSGIKNMRVVYALPYSSSVELKYPIIYSWIENYYTYQSSGGSTLYICSVVLIAIMAFVSVLSLKEDHKHIEERQEEKIHLPIFLKYPTELSVFILCCSINVIRRFQYDMLYESGTMSIIKTILARKFKEITVEEVVTTILAFVMVCLLFFVIYWAILSLVPVFKLGLKKYIKEYSFCFHFLPWLKSVWKQYTEMIRHVDFTKKTNRVIFRIVITNFIILSIISCFWIFGIILLFVYSVVVCILMRRYYISVSNDYQILLKAMGRIADGELDTTIDEDIGLFEPFKEEMGQIQEGFKKAVGEEVKSQRLRTELITNVSHDLKTPLTAITTYIELLQREDVTEDERKKYLTTLQNKAHRLNILIEDLFEVSKATTDNITLDLQEVDIVELIKQIGVEFEDKFNDQKLTLNYQLPKEHIMLLLDGQKTYRIFENLYGNIIKYAMYDSRVYVDVEKTESKVEIILRNISATALDFRTEDITERFVRGDMSRNSEGAGLGLAIAKSFTELQKGKFRIDIDGDLFKVYLTWSLSSS